MSNFKNEILSHYENVTGRKKKKEGAAAITKALLDEGAERAKSEYVIFKFEDFDILIKASEDLGSAFVSIRPALGSDWGFAPIRKTTELDLYDIMETAKRLVEEVFN